MQPQALRWCVNRDADRIERAKRPGFCRETSTGASVGSTFAAPGTDVAPIIKLAPSQFLGFLYAPFEPGAAIGYPTPLIVTALHVSPEFDGARAIGIAYVAEQESAKSHNQCPPFKSGYTADRARAREGVSHKFDQVIRLLALAEYDAAC